MKETIEKQKMSPWKTVGFLAIVTGLLISAASGQTLTNPNGNLAVHVTDTAGRPLAGADVAVNSASLGGCSTAGPHQVTNLSGNVTFTNLSTANGGGYLVCASVQGYQSNSESVSVYAGGTTNATLVLLQSPSTPSADYTPGIVVGSIIGILGVIVGLAVAIQSRKPRSAQPSPVSTP